jgi:predicted RecA/RadA family phage recombinase
MIFPITGILEEIEGNIKIRKGEKGDYKPKGILWLGKRVVNDWKRGCGRGWKEGSARD